MNPSSSDCFALLGLPARFDLAPAEIEAAFHARSRATHPDHVQNASAADRVRALSDAKAVSDAYHVVRRAGSRAEHLLAQKGLVIADHERMDPEFLQEILEAREALAEARVAGRLDEVATFERAMKARRAALVAELAPLFTAEQFADIKARLIALRYLDRYLEECATTLDDAG